MQHLWREVRIRRVHYVMHGDWRVFFCQAEDGIRVFHVTGVQTCALPIFYQIFLHQALYRIVTVYTTYLFHFQFGDGLTISRSEERRVGKDWRFRGWRRDEEKDMVGVLQDMGRSTMRQAKLY